MKTATVNLPLHGGKAPYWLFWRMMRLSRHILILMAEDKGPAEIMRRLSDPLWFQALGCVLGFDWHSSGVTTTVCGALKEASKGIEKYTGLYVAGGKGGTSRKTPLEIQAVQEKSGNDLSNLVYSSRMSAKVDSNALQDGYQLYHHSFFFTPDGKNWAVVQQGMNENNRMARRYHWNSEIFSDFVCRPHSAVCCNSTSEVLNLVDSSSSCCRNTISELACSKPAQVLKDFKLLQAFEEKHKTPLQVKEITYPKRHDIRLSDMNTNRLEKILLSSYEKKPQNFEKLLAIQGVGPKTIRALAMISQLIYGVKYSTADPVKYSFAHGGKDGIPYPVDRQNYDRSIDILERAVKSSGMQKSEKISALKRLAYFYG
ncbi:MAG: DUF763 domain-containing protein [Actinobacteria bacterium]|nr:DUF763 domain-containing protein [Actinomycetota bacterium]